MFEREGLQRIVSGAALRLRIKPEIPREGYGVSARVVFLRGKRRWKYPTKKGRRRHHSTDKIYRCHLHTQFCSRGPSSDGPLRS